LSWAATTNDTPPIMLTRILRCPAVRRRALSSSAAAASAEHDVPTVEEVRAAARFNQPSGYTNELLLDCADKGDVGSVRELLTRHIMRVDGVEWEDADAKVDTIEGDAKTGLLKHKFPYFFGIAFGFVSAWGSIPMVFDLNTALWFNELYVTTEIPPDEDLETWLEVGAWSWNWMEPWTGTISFQLLALQFMRLQMLNVGYRPYTGWVIGARQRRLTQMYPEYAGRELEQYCLYSTGLGEVVNE
jgi:hypothetical protein